jgi:hypothetical protein
MPVDPIPVVALDGVDIAAGADPDGGWPGLMVVDGASVTWGRDEPLAQPTPATATVQLFDPTGSWAASYPGILGAPITLRWSVPGEERIYFTGRVSAVDIERPRRYRSAEGRALPGSIVTLSCSSLLVDLANKPLSGSGLQAQTFAERRARYAADALPAVTGISTRPAWDAVPLAEDTSADRGTVLELIGQLLGQAGGDRWTYDPHTRAIDWVPRRVFAPAAAARLVRNELGLVAVTGPAADKAGAAPAPALSVPAGVLEYDDAVSRDIGSALTRVEVKWQSFTGYDTSTGGSQYADATMRYLLPGDETVTGIRALSVESGITDSTWAQNVAYDLADRAAGEARGWLPAGPLTWTVRDGFPSIEHARLFLAGCETHGVFWVAGSWFPGAGVLPLFGVMGGVIAYESGRWRLELRPAPCARTADADGVAWEELDPALTWNDLDASVAFEDMRFVTAGTIGT